MFTKSQLEGWRDCWDLLTSGNCWVDIVCRYPDDQMLTARAITIFDLFTGEVLTHPVTLFFSNARKYNETLYRLHVDCQ
jgi:hypothetical protein